MQEDSPNPYSDERVAAARSVQRCWRYKMARREGKLRLSLWPSLADLRCLYLDEVAISAGAQDTEYYTDEMIVAREALKRHEEVVAAIQVAWDRLCSAAGSQGQVSYNVYCTMSRKLYLLFKAQERDDYIDAEDAVESIATDWYADAGGKPHMDFEDFLVTVLLCHASHAFIRLDAFKPRKQWPHRLFSAG